MSSKFYLLIFALSIICHPGSKSFAQTSPVLNKKVNETISVNRQVNWTSVEKSTTFPFKKKNKLEVIWKPLKEHDYLSRDDAMPHWQIITSADQAVRYAEQRQTAIVWNQVNSNYVDKASEKESSWIKVGEEKIPNEVIAIEQDLAQYPRKKIKQISSLNRSIVFDKSRVGPDVGFLVPQGFKWSNVVQFDSSIRGWSRREKGENFAAFNNGDAVGQFYWQPLHSQDWSFGASLGVRSIINNPNRLSESSTGEGLSAGFRLDYKLSDTAGIAIGAEQLIHFDDKTDTGRDIYLVASKAFWLGSSEASFPLLTTTAGIGTGYLGRNQYLQFGCSNFVDAGIAQVDNETFYPLCWNPIGSVGIVINQGWSVFTEYNGFSYVVGTSISPFKEVPLRATWGITLAQDFGGGLDDYRFEFDKARWFFRLSLGF
jgi:hypothetical protein